MKPLPCPFCGGRPEISRQRAHLPENCDPFWVIECPKENDCDVWPMATGNTRADAIRFWNTRAPEKPLWISVDESLPDDEIEVLVVSICGDPTIAFMTGLIWRSVFDQAKLNGVTHWMHLPAKPEAV